MNGKFKPEDKVWYNFINSAIKECDTYYIGSCSNASDTYETCGYLNASIYALRVYNRALHENEVIKNYEKSIEYHSLSTE